MLGEFYQLFYNDTIYMNPVKKVSESSIKRWMKANLQDHYDLATGELNTTTLVEAWDRACASGGDTLDPCHIAWDVASNMPSNCYEDKV